MKDKRYTYDDGETKVELGGFLKHFQETDEMLSQLDIHQRIRILEFVTGIRDISEVAGEEEAFLLMRILEERLMGHTSAELNPNTWTLPDSYGPRTI